MVDRAPVASVVIPTCNRPALLARCLYSLMLQRPLGNQPPIPFEILVVDDGEDGSTATVVESFAGVESIDVRLLVASDTKGPAAARNLGWRSSRAPIIAFTDDDTIADALWLAQGLQALGADVAAVTGRVIVPVGSSPTDYERQVEGLSRAEFVTANCFVRRSALEAVGGFDTTYRKAWREDSDLQFALLERGLKIGRAVEAVVIHPVRPTPWGWSLRSQANVYYDALLYRKFPRLYRTRLRPHPPYAYYGAVLALLTGICAALTGHTALAWTAIAIWLCLTVRFTIKRLAGTSKSASHVAEMLMTSMLIPPLSLYWRLRGAWHFRVLFW